MGTYEKIMVEFKEAFWPKDKPFIACCPSSQAAVSGNPLSGTAVGGHPHAPSASTTLPSPSSFFPSILLPPLADAESDRLPALLLPCPVAGDETARESLAPPRAVVAAEISAAIEKPPLLPTAGLGAAVRAEVSNGARVEASNGSPASAVTATALPAPVLLENYLWSKGVPVLTAAITGARARYAQAAAAVAAAAAADGDREGGGEEWRDAHAREMYRQLIKPAVDDAFGKGKGTPEPVSVSMTR